MPANVIAAVAANVALTLATEIAVVSSAPAAPTNQVNTNGAGTLIEAEVTITGAASATSATLKLRRGTGLAGADILASDPVVSVDAAATDRTVKVSAIETDANFNANNGAYTLTANQAGAATTARRASIKITPLAAGV